MVDENQEKSIDFNVEDFVDRIYNTIDSYRSQVGLQTGVVLEHPTDGTGGKNQAESKINCFYRLLGLPAVRSDITDKSVELGSLSQHDTLNYFPDFKINGTSVSAAVTQREELQSLPIDIQQSIDVIRDVLSYDAALKPNNRRESIFPMVVSAAIPIFPLARRTAPLFYPGEFTVDGKSIKLTRPFIEHVIYIRTKASAGGGDESLFNSLQAEVNNANFTLDPSLKGKLLELRIVSKLIKSLRSIAHSWIVVGEDIKKLQKDVQFIPAPKTNPQERAGNVTLPADSTITVQDITEQGLETTIAKLKEQLAKEESLLNSLPSESIKSADRIRRIEQDQPNLNIVDDAMISEFQSLIMFERDAVNEQLKEALDKKARLLNQFEKARKLLVYLNGETTGLSIIDIVCVLLALFTVELDVLIGLVNEKSRKYLLETDNFYRSQNPASSDATAKNESNIDKILNTPPKTVDQAVSALQGKVEENFKLLEVFIKNTKNTDSGF